MARFGLPLLVLLAAACAAEERDERPSRVPSTVEALVLARDSLEITPVVFPHAVHSDETLMGRPVKCADCHHPIADDAGALPARCGSCHPHEAEPDDAAPDI